MILTIIIILAILIAIILIGTPVAFAIGSTAVISTLLFMSPSNLSQFGSIAFSRTTSMNQLVAPLFILMAEFLTRGNIAKDIFTVLNEYFYRFKAGLAISATIASTIFAALCGSSPATAASIGRISVQQMVEKGYREDFAVGVVAAGGTLGIMIPPSITFVTYGIITENSIAKLLIAGILPGVLISFLLCVFIILRVKINPSLVKDVSTANLVNNANRNSRNSRQNLLLLIPPLILIIFVLGSMYTGIATPTEAAGIGAIGALLIVVSMKRLTKETMKGALAACARTSSMIVFMTVCGLCLSYVLSYLGLPQEMSRIITSLGVNKYIVIILVYILWLILGCFMDPGGMIILTVPFIYPTIIALGFDPIWLGVVAVLCAEIGMITPPVGLNLFVVQSVTQISMNKIIYGSIPFILLLLFALIILTIFPQIALYLPSLM